jgi:SnoaL-like domain
MAASPKAVTDDKTPELADRDLLLSAYKAFNERNLEHVLTLMHPNVDWPNGMEGGRVHSRDGVREYWTRQWRVVDPHVEPIQFEKLPDGRIMTDVHQVVRDMAGKTILEQMIQHIYLIRESQIVHMEIRDWPKTAPADSKGPSDPE